MSFGAETLPATVDLGLEPGINVRVTGDTDDGLGSAVLLDDVNGDDYADLVIGAWTDGQGKVIVLFGAPFEPGVPLIDVGCPSTFIPNRTYLGRADGGYFSASLASGYVDGDTIGDLVSTALFSSGDGMVTTRCGEGYVILGTAGE